MKPALLFGPICIAAILCGCDAPVDRYPPNDVYALVVATSRQAEVEPAAEDTATVVVDWFGTPLDPRWPAEQLSDPRAAGLVSQDHLDQAAGPVFSDQDGLHFGLFNEHCVTCHGVSGGGNGPASQLQNPYPRDFRSGVFKWKSTKRKSKPTKEDLRRLIEHGAPGTGMPSFERIAEQEIAALVDYTIFLAVRGEFERRLLAGAIDELGYETSRPEAGARLVPVDRGETPPADTPESDGVLFAREILDDLVGDWLDATRDVIPVSAETAADAESIARGRELFHGQIVNCAGCHGVDGNGQTALVDWDDWAKEYTTKLSITPSDRDAVRPFRRAGAPRPRQIQPRRIASGVFRGGSDSETLFRRFVAGIAGTPMPAVQLSDTPALTAVTAEQVWDVVHYVQSISGTRDDGDEQ